MLRANSLTSFGAKPCPSKRQTTTKKHRKVSNFIIEIQTLMFDNSTLNKVFDKLQPQTI